MVITLLYPTLAKSTSCNLPSLTCCSLPSLTNCLLAADRLQPVLGLTASSAGLWSTGGRMVSPYHTGASSNVGRPIHSESAKAHQPTMSANSTTNSPPSFECLPPLDWRQLLKSVENHIWTISSQHWLESTSNHSKVQLFIRLTMKGSCLSRGLIKCF